MNHNFISPYHEVLLEHSIAEKEVESSPSITKHGEQVVELVIVKFSYSGYR